MKSSNNKIEILNEMSLSIRNEDHTLLNPLKYILNKYQENVEFSGYTIPHPSEDLSILSIQFCDEKKQNINNFKDEITEGIVKMERICDKLLNSEF